MRLDCFPKKIWGAEGALGGNYLGNFREIWGGFEWDCLRCTMVGFTPNPTISSVQSPWLVTGPHNIVLVGDPQKPPRPVVGLEKHRSPYPLGRLQDFLKNADPIQKRLGSGSDPIRTQSDSRSD